MDYKKIFTIVLCICFGILLFMNAVGAAKNQMKITGGNESVATVAENIRKQSEEAFDTEENVVPDTEENTTPDTEDAWASQVQSWAEELDAKDDQISFEKVEDGYELTLYDKESRAVYSEVYPADSRLIRQGLLWVNEISEGVLEIKISVGSSATYIYYFDKESAELSPTYFNPIIVNNKYVAYMEDGVLIFTDLFQRGSVYMEIERNFAERANPIDAVIGIKMVDHNTIELEYYEGEDFTEKSEQIPLESTAVFSQS